MQKKQQLSKRNIIANKLAKLVREKGLNKRATAKLVEENDRKFYRVDFGKGLANIYGEDFIQIQYEFADKKGEPVFDSGDHALRFFRLAVLEGKFKEADKIPTKEGTGEVDKKEK
jgi:hypothetical protein